MKQKILGSNEPPFNGRVFLIDNNKRRWLGNANILKELGYIWPDDVQWVNADILKKIPIGASLPIHSGSSKNGKRFFRKKLSMHEERELVVANLKGKGVEFGAAANPMAVQAGVQVMYADLFDTPTLEEELYISTGHEYVTTDIISSFDEMKNIQNNSLDFIIGSHVIEHVRNPIQAFEQAWFKLKKEGLLVLIIPKKERTLDKKRSPTTLGHVIEDFQKPDRYRDAFHIMEFHTFSKTLPLVEVYNKMLDSLTNDYHSMHYHVWNERTFTELINYIRKHHHPWKVVLNKAALPGNENYEFYVVLQK